MARCLISFGANLGSPAVTILQATEQIQQLLGRRLISMNMSRLVRTPAVGGPTGQPPFVNAVGALEVIDCTAWDVWHIVREVEHALGRVRQERWEARRIDLDVLMFDDQRIWTPQFKLPHPRMIMRRFILQPALDVARDWQEPVTGWTIGQLAQSLASGPASILLISHDAHRDQAMIERAASIAQCELAIPAIGATIDAPIATGHALNQRWLAQMDMRELQLHTPLTISPWPRQVFVLAPPSHVQDAAWEDVHRQLARWMRLCPTLAPSAAKNVEPPNADAPAWPLNGPRYLLSTDDLAWAQHEIVAALDAMDCPVEPI